MKNPNLDKIEKLINKGVRIPNPESIEIGDEVDLNKISGQDVTLYSGCKIYGESTLILHGSRLGYESPVTLENCQLGPKVELNGGYFKEAIFLKKAKIGSGAHVREGTILEEEAICAHTVGLKQTILFPFVTLGSLINFCDCLMAGGTSRKNHSEVGSSYIHFNFTPNQDKATPSLMGDVPNGVMLNQDPIFLGGQGGIVGPCRLAYGTVIAAGTIHRKDELRPNRLMIGGPSTTLNTQNNPGVYLDVKRIVGNNLVYIANLIALMAWYKDVRTQFISTDFPDTLLDGLAAKLEMVIQERLKRLQELGEKLNKQNNEIKTHWYELEACLTQDHLKLSKGTNSRDAFLKRLGSKIEKNGKDYISVITGLNIKEIQTGTRWLQEIVDETLQNALKIIPSYQ